MYAAIFCTAVWCTAAWCWRTACWFFFTAAFSSSSICYAIQGIDNLLIIFCPVRLSLNLSKYFFFNKILTIPSCPQTPALSGFCTTALPCPPRQCKSPATLARKDKLILAFIQFLTYIDRRTVCNFHTVPLHFPHDLF